MQGQTISPPWVLVTSFEKVFQPAMAYVTLSRVTSLDQIFILNSLHEEKIYPSQKALIALKGLEERSINRTLINKNDNLIYISYLNVQNMNNHYQDIRRDHHLQKNDLIVFGETWIPKELSDKDSNNKICQHDYQSTFCNEGNGKGIVGYCNEKNKIQKI